MSRTSGSTSSADGAEEFCRQNIVYYYNISILTAAISVRVIVIWTAGNLNISGRRLKTHPFRLHLGP